MNSGIYEIENLIDGKRYVGSAVSLDSRLPTHLKALRSGKHHNRHLQRAWDRYGEAESKKKKD